MDRRPSKRSTDTSTNTNNGTTQIAWYGQGRAKGLTHAEALADTIAHYRLTTYDWYMRRFPQEV